MRRLIHHEVLTGVRIAVLFVFLVANLSFAQQAKTSLVGTIVDASSRSPIPFVSIKITESLDGCNSDIEGNFRLVLASDQDSVKVEISCIGYRKTQRLLSSKNASQIIFLDPETYELNEVGVYDERIAVESLILKASEKIESNFYCKDFGFNIFCARQLFDYASNYPVLTQEVVAEGFYGNGYRERKNAHRAADIYFNVIAQRTDGQNAKYSNFDYGLFTGYGLIVIDIVRHSNNPLTKKNIKDFLFRLDSVSSKTTDTVYHISFSDKKTNYDNSAVMGAKKYSGNISISLPSYSILKYEGAILLDRDARFTSQRGFSGNPLLSFFVKYGNEKGKQALTYAKSSMVIYDQEKRLRFDQEFIPYQFNFSTPKRVADNYSSLNVKSNDNFWKNYRKPEID